MGAVQQALLMAGTAAAPTGTLVTDLRFESAPNGNWTNSAARGPTVWGTYVNVSQSSTQAYEGTYSGHFERGSIAASSDDFILGTSDFEISIRAYFVAITPETSGNGILQYDPGGSVVGPIIGLAHTTGYLYYANNAGLTILSSTTPSLNTWHEINVKRAGGTTTLKLDGVSLGSGADTANGTARTLRIGAFGSPSGETVNAYFDKILIYNSNV